jgi:hypothetical protein
MKPRYPVFLTLAVSLIFILVSGQMPATGATSGPVPMGELKIGVPTLGPEYSKILL